MDKHEGQQWKTKMRDEHEAQTDDPTERPNTECKEDEKKWKENYLL